MSNEDGDRRSSIKSEEAIDSIFSGYGSPALMSQKEPAIRLLFQTYSESFAFTKGSDDRVHLFMIKLGLWVLVWTFSSKDFDERSSTIATALTLVEKCLTGQNDGFKQRLDKAVVRAQSRLKEKIARFESNRAA